MTEQLCELPAYIPIDHSLYDYALKEMEYTDDLGD
jgi:hypothetical protein